MRDAGRKFRRRVSGPKAVAIARDNGEACDLRVAHETVDFGALCAAAHLGVDVVSKEGKESHVKARAASGEALHGFAHVNEYFLAPQGQSSTIAAPLSADY